MALTTLIVDDSPSFLQSAMRFLSMDSRIDVVGLALSGREAIEQTKLLKPDLVLMDLAMPGMNGLEATRELKAGFKPPHVVILTLHDTQEYRSAAQEARADGFIAKSDFGLKLLPLIETLHIGQPALEQAHAPCLTPVPDCNSDYLTTEAPPLAATPASSTAAPRYELT